jgi:amino acid adenylation domain-containing protein
MGKRAPLTFSQESLWFLQQLDPENNAYNSSQILKITGGIDPDSMSQALNELVRRHEPLRTIYPSEGGKPVQVVQPFVPFALPIVDYTQFAEDDRRIAVEKYLKENGNRPFDLQHGPVNRAALLHLSETEDILFFCTHHVCSDAWSRQEFTRELIQSYEAFAAGSEPALPNFPISYTDYALWQREWLREETLTVFIDHWKSIFSGELPVLDLPTDRPRPMIQSYSGARYIFQFPEALTVKVKTFAQKERVTPFQLYLAVFAVLLKRYSGQSDIIIGCPFANRQDPVLDHLVGLFVNTLPVRIDLSGDPSVHDLLCRVRDVMLDAFVWQAAPFEAIVSELAPERDLSRTPIFQVVINMHNVPGPQSLSSTNVVFEPIYREDVPSPFDLSLEFNDSGGSASVFLHYNADLFDESTIAHLAAHYQNLLSEFSQNPSQHISGLEMLVPSERNRIIFDWNDTQADFPPVCVHDLVAEQIKKTPQAVAVTCNGRSLTYAQLESRSNQLAHYLIQRGVMPQSRIGIYMPRSEDSVVALLAILKAGCAYTSLERTYPPERIAEIVNDCEPAAILTVSAWSDQLPAQTQLVCLDADAGQIEACSMEPPVVRIDASAPMYFIYTSGSTGRPKGVVNVHRGVVNYLEQAKRQFHFCQSDVLIQLTPFAFDTTLYEIFGPLTAGGRICLLDDDQMRDPDYINRAIVDQEATYLSMVPTMLRALCQSALPRGLIQHHLRLIFVSGEALLRADVELARRVYGNKNQFVNQYGPAECSIIHTSYIVPGDLPKGLDGIPIGKPIANTRAYVLDENFHPVPVGVKGELYISGVNVGPGYWKQPELTAEKFLVDPFFPGERMYRSGDLVRQFPDGNLYYLGRADRQVKIRGYRVELEEIEAVIAKVPGVTQTAVNAWGANGAQTLAAYFTVRKDAPAHILDTVRRDLTERLPFYMLPSSFQILDAFPMTATGKIDRKALPEPENGENGGTYVAPRNEVERRLVAIWERLLEREPIGVLDNFFELGGHSLLAVRLIALIQEEFGHTLPLISLFKAGTIEALASLLTSIRSTPTLNGIFPILSDGKKRPFYILSEDLYMGSLAALLGTDRPVYGLQPYQKGVPVFRTSVQDTARIYFNCLTNFDPDGPYLLLGHSAGGLFALELARLLRQAGKQVSFLGLLDTSISNPDNKVDQVVRFRYHWSRMRGLSLKQILRYLGSGLAAGTARTRDRLTQKKAIIQSEMTGQDLEGRDNLIAAYHPKPYDGKVVFFAATDRPPHLKRDLVDDWSGILTGSLETVMVEGTHMSIAEPPQVGQLAEKILMVLDRDKIV